MFRLGPPSEDRDVKNSISMTWYFFLRYIFLSVGTVLNFLNGVLMFKEGIIQISKMGIIFILFGAFFVFLGVYSIITRSALAKFRRSAPLHLTILFTSSAVVNFVANFNIFVIIPLIILMFANKVYFMKRDHLFNN